ncbi:MAG: protein kinase [Candidatus Sericytochromatia bacterium]
MSLNVNSSSTNWVKGVKPTEKVDPIQNKTETTETPNINKTNTETTEDSPKTNRVSSAQIKDDIDNTFESNESHEGINERANTLFGDSNTSETISDTKVDKKLSQLQDNGKVLNEILSGENDSVNKIPDAPKLPEQKAIKNTPTIQNTSSLQEQIQGKIQEINQKSTERKIEKNTNLLQDVIDNGVKGDVTKYDMKIEEFTPSLISNLKKADIGNFINHNFADEILKSGNLTTNQKKLNDEVSQKATKLMMSIIPNTELTFKFATKSEIEAKNEIARGIGLVKDKHEGKNYEDLPKNKRELVDAIYVGIQKGLPTALNNQLSHLSKKSEAFISDKFMNDNLAKDFAFGTVLKSSDEIKIDIMKGLGIVTQEALDKPINKWGEKRPIDNFINELSPNQKKIVDSIHDGIKTSINKNSTNKASNERLEVPGIDAYGKNVTLNPVKSFTLNGKTYEFSKFLGQGGLGNVYKYTNKDNPKDVVAVKELKEDGQKAREEMVSEAVAHRHVSGHKNIADLKGFVNTKEDKPLMVLEFCGGGDLEKTGKKINDLVNDGKISKDVADLLTIKLYKGVVDGMAFFQKDKNSVHLDLKPENIFISSNGTPKIGDTGLTKTNHEEWKNSDFATTLMYKSPELSSQGEKNEENIKPVTEKSDTWSLGMMLHLTTGGKDIFEAKFGYLSEQKIREFGNDPNNRMRIPTEDKPVLTEMDKLINSMMHPDPAQRPNISAVAQHSIFTDPKLDNPALGQLLESIINKDESRLASLSKEVQGLVS